MFYEDTAKMKKEVLLQIPAGTDTATAIHIMAKNTFQFSEVVQDDNEFIAHPHIDYLLFFHDRPGIWSMDRWKAFVIFRNGKVTDVFILFNVIML